MALANGDIRTEARGLEIIERVVATGSLVLKTIGGNRAGEVAAHRFLDSPRVSAGTITSTVGHRTAEQCKGRHIIAVQDTTELNFPDRPSMKTALGTGANGYTPAYFIHPAIAIDAADGALIGLLHAHIWTRSQERVSDHHGREFSHRESCRWRDANEAAAQLLVDAASVTMIADRESDIYELFALRPSKLDMIVRARHNRPLSDGTRLYDCLQDAPVLTSRTVLVAPKRIGDKGREATLEIRARRVILHSPLRRKVAGVPDCIKMTYVEARELHPPEKQAPLHWRLLTTHEAITAQAADGIVQAYKMRWRIEQLFRALKSDGLDLEESQISDKKRLFALAAIELAAAVRTIQLVDARDGNSRPASDVVDEALHPAIQLYSNKLEGKTEKQKNPHAPGTLAWLSWVVARCGGWNCYYKPPGPKTMRAGWTHLAAVLAGFVIAKTSEANV